MYLRAFGRRATVCAPFSVFTGKATVCVSFRNYAYEISPVSLSKRITMSGDIKGLWSASINTKRSFILRTERYVRRVTAYYLVVLIRM